MRPDTQDQPRARHLHQRRKKHDATRNLVYDNADRGVQLYPDADCTLVEGNVIDGNGQNLVFSGSGNDSSSENTVRNNVISNPRVGWNVSGNWDRTGEVGRDNEVHDNCVWASDGLPNGGISPEERGFDAYDILIAGPAYADPKAGDFELGDDGPCGAMLDKWMNKAARSES